MRTAGARGGGWRWLPSQLAAWLLASVLVAPVHAAAPLATVDDVDLERYMGRWHQVAHLPNWFQRACASATSATYARRPDGRVSVLNTCRNEDGELERAEGVARLNPVYDDPARLEVRFAPAWLGFLPFVWGDYWILALEPDYSAVLVGAPSREYLWVLARTPSLPRQTYTRLLDVARAQGFELDALRLEHPGAVQDAATPGE
ncbi:MAG: lipocalin family protein [Gammaproteobacteria bacterium]